MLLTGKVNQLLSHSLATRWVAVTLLTGMGFAATTILPGGHEAPSFLFPLAAVAVSTWIAGVAGGVFSLLTGEAAILVVLILPDHRFGMPSHDDIARMLNYVAIAALTILVTRRLRHAEQRNWELLESERAARAVADEDRERLRASDERLAGIISSAMDAIITVDAAQRIVLFNAAAEEMFGHPAQEVLGGPLSRLIPERYRHAHQGHVQAYGQTGVTRRSMTSPGMLYAVRADGQEFPIEATISQVTAGGQRLFTVILRDITERTSTQQALIRSEKLASVGRMAATVAHEINNPLESAINLVYLAARDPGLLPETRRYLALADGELGRVAHLTKQTLGFYRENSAPASVSLPELINDLLPLYAPKLMHKNITVMKEFAASAAVLAIAGEVRQVISNLVANSIDALAENGRLYLRVGPARWDGWRGVRLTIADSGCGMDPAVRARIFEPFFTTKKDVGTGLGLWITREIVDKCGGSIRFRSKPGAGTVFSVFLPEAAIAKSAAAGDGCDPRSACA